MGDAVRRGESASGIAIVMAATLGGLGGCVVGAVAGFVGGLLGVDTSSGLAGLAPMFYGLIGALLAHRLGSQT